MRSGSAKTQYVEETRQNVCKLAFPQSDREAKTLYPPALTELTPEAVKAALESSSKDNDKLAEALRKLAGVARRQFSRPMPAFDRGRFRTPKFLSGALHIQSQDDFCPAKNRTRI